MIANIAVARKSPANILENHKPKNKQLDVIKTATFVMSLLYFSIYSYRWLGF